MIKYTIFFTTVSISNNFILVLIHWQKIKSLTPNSTEYVWTQNSTGKNTALRETKYDWTNISDKVNLSWNLKLNNPSSEFMLKRVEQTPAAILDEIMIVKMFQ